MEQDWLAHPQLIAPSLEEHQCPLEDLPGLDPRLVEAARAAGFHRLFPVQKAVLEALQAHAASDLLVSASTGSGKTLAYCLPLVNALAPRLVMRLRALVVVPGRELAHQVSAVLEPLCRAAGLAVATCVGQTSLAGEQRKLVGPQGASHADILVATPGRLVDHLRGTPGFTLQHLQWLVIDEADRLLDQTFQDWLPLVLDGACNPDDSDHSTCITLREGQTPLEALHGLACWTTPLRKLLFSATLTRNPGKLAQLHLKQPLFLSVSADSNKYSVPEDLEEFMLVAGEGEKVHALLYLMQTKGIQRALCFTKSLEATDRLASLLQAAALAQSIAAFSGDLHASKRHEILASFNAGNIQVLVCSDGAARGLDLDQVDAVINYDIPVHVKTYIHRVGRTARAGNRGAAYSLLEAREAHHFKTMLEAGRSAKAPVQKLKIRSEDLQDIRQQVDQAISSLQGDQLAQAALQHFQRR